VFEKDESITDFNVTNPLHVATKIPDSPVEEWHSKIDELVRRLR